MRRHVAAKHVSVSVFYYLYLLRPVELANLHELYNRRVREIYPEDEDGLTWLLDDPTVVTERSKAAAQAEKWVATYRDPSEHPSYLPQPTIRRRPASAVNASGVAQRRQVTAQIPPTATRPVQQGPAATASASATASAPGQARLNAEGGRDILIDAHVDEAHLHAVLPVEVLVRVRELLGVNDVVVFDDAEVSGLVTAGQAMQCRCRGGCQQRVTTPRCRMLI